MIEVREVEEAPGSMSYSVVIDGAELPRGESSISFENFQPSTLTVHISREFSAQMPARPFSELSTKIHGLHFYYGTSLLPESNVAVNISRHGRKRFTVDLEFTFDAINWKHLWSVREYIEEFGRSAEQNKRLGIKWQMTESLFGISHGFILTLPTVKRDWLTIESVISNHVADVSKLHKLTEALLQTKIQSPHIERIIRSIEFPPEYRRSGITILSYFAEILRYKNLSEDVKVSIAQDGLNVSLIIESPTGQREEVQRTLEAYALVITGRQPIETLTTDPYEVAELKSQLSLANVQIETHRALLAAKTSEVSDLRSEVRETKAALQRVEQRADEDGARFLTLFEGLVSHNTTLATGFKELAEQAARAQHSALAGALDNLYKVVERGVREEDREEVIQNLAAIRQQAPGVFKRVSDILVSGAISGAAGNYLYAWLQFFIGSLPK